MTARIGFRNVGFRYANRREAPAVLQDFNLELQPGEFHVLLGPSGCGKTTVLNLLAGFLKVTSGEILVDGQVVTSPNSDRVVIFQGDDSLFPWLTAVESVEFGLRVAGVPKAERRKQAMEYLDLVGLAGHPDAYPSQLSGGMKQRVQLARALVVHARVLLMDEPFAALDAQTRSVLQGELGKIWKRTGCTILFITHDIAEAILLADRISVMTTDPDGDIEETIVVDLERPRSLADPGFGPLYVRLNKLLGRDIAHAV